MDQMIGCNKKLDADLGGMGWQGCLRSLPPSCLLPLRRLPPQVTKYVEREIINHRQLVNPHIVQFKEVCGGGGDV